MIIPAYNPIVARFLYYISNAIVHNKTSKGRKLSKNYQFVGLMGEWQFAQEMKLPIDLTLKIGGDDRVDFYTKCGTIDVKTYRKAWNLLREINVKHADILVLASYDDQTQEVKLLGWETDENMLKCPKKDFGYGIINHYKNALELRSMDELRQMING